MSDSAVFLLMFSIAFHIGLIIVNIFVAERKHLKEQAAVVMLSLPFAPLMYLYVLAVPANGPDSSKK